MFTMDVPYVPAMEYPIVQAQVVTPAATPTDYILTACQETASTGNPKSADRAVDPAYMLTIYLGSHGHPPIAYETIASIKPILLESTKNGKIIAGRTNDNGRIVFHYDPEPNYVGNDKAVFLAAFKGKRYKTVVNLVVSLNVGESPLLEGEEPVCPPPKLIKVAPANTRSSLDNMDNITINVASRENVQLAQTTAQSITLDDDASGHGWFIDPTLYINEEYLPTSNPYEWQARPGSAADGKMDMLTVLWHEYGHALGLEHTAAGHDLMSTTLTPGVRRLLTPEELAVLNPPQSPFVKGGREVEQRKELTGMKVTLGGESKRKY